jgi:hypothetical protein
MVAENWVLVSGIGLIIMISGVVLLLVQSSIVIRRVVLLRRCRLDVRWGEGRRGGVMDA